MCNYIQKEIDALDNRCEQLEASEATTRRKLASMCETVVRCVMALEQDVKNAEECLDLQMTCAREVCKKLRAAVLAAT